MFTTPNVKLVLARATLRKRKQQDALDRAREPVLTYYVVPRALYERHVGGPWLELASAADAAGAGCRIERCRKRDLGLAVADGFAVVYEGAPGQIFIARQGW